MTAARPTSVRIRAATWDEPAAMALRRAMDVEMAARYRDRSAGMSEAIQAALHVDPHTVASTLLALDANGPPIGHAALRRRDDAPQRGDLEIKRVYVADSARGQGVADALMAALETEAVRLGAPRLILQTGDRQTDAERVYQRRGYTRIPIFAPYEVITFSRCYALNLVAA